MANVTNSPLSLANQEKAQRKIAINGSAAMVCYAIATVLSVQSGMTTAWLSNIAGHAAILATITAFVWPIYLVVQESRET